MKSDLCSCIRRVGSSVSNLYTSLADREPAGSNRYMEPCTEHSCWPGAEGGPVSSTLSVHMVPEFDIHEMSVSGDCSQSCLSPLLVKCVCDGHMNDCICRTPGAAHCECISMSV